QRLNLHAEHRREIADDWRPAVSRVGRRVDLASRRPEIDAARIERVDGHGIAQYVDVAVALWKPLSQRLPLVTAGAAPVHAELALRRIVFRVAFDRNDENGLRLVRVHVDGESEVG